MNKVLSSCESPFVLLISKILVENTNFHPFTAAVFLGNFDMVKVRVSNSGICHIKVEHPEPFPHLFDSKRNRNRQHSQNRYRKRKAQFRFYALFLFYLLNFNMELILKIKPFFIPDR